MQLEDATVAGEVTLGPATVRVEPDAVPTPAQATDKLEQAATDGLEEVLHTVEGMRVLTMATYGVIACVVTSISIAIIGRDPVATAFHAGALVLAGIVSGYVLIRLRRDPTSYSPLWTIYLGAACATAAVSAFFYWGFFSAAVIVVPIGAFLLAQTRHKWGAYLIASLFLGGHLVFATLVAVGVLEDRGINPMGDRPLVIQFLRIATIQVIMVLTFWAARRLALSARKTVLKLDDAMRAIAQRDALLVEAARERDEALQVNAPGRYSGKTLGRYTLGNVIGRGAMGVVYEATSADGSAAVKLLHPHVLADPEQFQRFCQELKIATEIDDPHVVRVFHAPMDGEKLPYMAMERLHGASLADYLTNCPSLDENELLEMIEQLGAGLEALHGKGIVHRDLKPRNVFRLEQPARGVRWKVLDLGTCKRIDNTDGTLTEFGHAVGTPAYMSPEQARGMQVDYRADLYALGVIAYRALTGRPPFARRQIPELLYEVVHEMPPRPSQLLPLPRDVDRVFAIALAKRAYERFSSVEEFSTALRAALRGELDESTRSAGDALIQRRPWAVSPQANVA